MKKLTVLVAALGWQDLERRGLTRLAGLEFTPRASVFPAVTCTAQATWRTGLTPREHGMVANGVFSRQLQRPSFWEQSAALVQGERVWSAARAQGARVGLFFMQQSLGEAADVILSPAPIHKHGGGMIMRNYTQPGDLAEEVRRECGSFPLHRYWGPLASPKVGDVVIKNFMAAYRREPCDWCVVYLPTLDYDLQRFGPESTAADRSFDCLMRQLQQLVDFAAHEGMQLEVRGDYAIEPVTAPPLYPNRTLRVAGFFNVRKIGSQTYPDFYTSRAFAMCDHAIAHVYVHHAEDVPAVARLFNPADYTVEVRAAQTWAHANAGEILLTARAGTWCAYPWWECFAEAPDWAGHVDIHNKPSYDPCELFFDCAWAFPPRTCQDARRILGTHGRPSIIAVA